MKIVIAGAVEIGSHLARMLSGNGHDITIIDSDQKLLSEVGSLADVLPVEGGSPAFAVLRFRLSPERTFVSSGGRLRRFGAAQSPPPNRRVPIQPAYSAEHGKQNSTNKSNS